MPAKYYNIFNMQSTANGLGTGDALAFSFLLNIRKEMISLVVHITLKLCTCSEFNKEMLFKMNTLAKQSFRLLLVSYNNMIIHDNYSTVCHVLLLSRLILVDISKLCKYCLVDNLLRIKINWLPCKNVTCDYNLFLQN